MCFAMSASATEKDAASDAAFSWCQGGAKVVPGHGALELSLLIQLCRQLDVP